MQVYEEALAYAERFVCSFHPLNEWSVMCHFAADRRVRWADDPVQFVAPAQRLRSYLSCFHFKIAGMDSGGLNGEI